MELPLILASRAAALPCRGMPSPVRRLPRANGGCLLDAEPNKASGNVVFTMRDEFMRSPAIVYPGAAFLGIN